MSGEVTLPRRKSAQRAGNTLRKFVMFQASKTEEDNDSDGFVGEQLSAESSSEDESEGVDSNEEAGTVADEELSGEEEVVVSNTYRRRAIWDTNAVHQDIEKKNKALYCDKMSFLKPADIQAVDYDEQINISVNEVRLPAFSSIDSDTVSIGYAGGTAVLARWVPNSALICLAVCNSSHIVTYTSPIIDSIQLWSYSDNKLRFLYSIRVTVFQDLLLYPYRTEDSSHFTLCTSCRNCVQIFSLPTSKPNGSSLHFSAKGPSFKLNIGTHNNHFYVDNLNWSLFNGKVYLLGGIDNGYIVIWNLNRVQDEAVASLPYQKVWAHHGHPISGISVCPQMQNFFCSIAQDSRIKFWDLKNLRQCLYSQTRPQKQLLLPARLHWCSFWNSVLTLSMMPVKELNSFRVHANSSIWQVSTSPLHDPSRRVLNFLLPRIFPDNLSGISPRCFDFCDASSVMAVGFQPGVVALLRIVNLWIVRGSKTRSPKSGHFLYLKASTTAKSGADISKEFKEDQDFINHFEFSLPMQLSQTFPSDKPTVSQFSKKSLSSVTHVEWQKCDSIERDLCVCYMSGLFQVLKPPETLFDPMGKL